MPLTAGVLAMTNLQAQIDGRQRQVMAGQQAAGDQAELIELVALRGEILGRISDYEWAGEGAEQLARDASADGTAFVTRARARGRFHRFTAALADLDRAKRLGADPAVVGAGRASVLQALGCYEAALAIYREASTRPADPGRVGALATLYAERGEIAAAELLFEQSQDRYRGVSPIPLALLDVRRGIMWLRQADLRQALTWFDAAVHLLPACAPAQGHLAEVEAALGDPEAAITRLRPLTTSSDDPRYAASLAQILGEAGRVQEAAEWRDKAASRYDELATRHPEAFADHAAEFCLHTGTGPLGRSYRPGA